MKILGWALFIMLAVGLASATHAQNAPPNTTPTPQPGTTEPSKTSSWKEGDPCVQNTKDDIDVELKSGRHPPGPELLGATYFLPAGASAEVVLKEPFKAGTQYFGYIERLRECPSSKILRHRAAQIKGGSGSFC